MVARSCEFESHPAHEVRGGYDLGVILSSSVMHSGR